MKLGRLTIDGPVAQEFAWRGAVFLIALAILILVTTRWSGWQGGPGWQSTDDAYLQSDLTPIAAKAPGYVRAVPVQDFELVKAGQLVAEVVDDDYSAAAVQAEANLAAAQARAFKAQAARQAANVRAARAVVAATGAGLAKNGRDIARERRLFETRSSSTEAAEKLAAQQAQTRAQAKAAAGTAAASLQSARSATGGPC